MTQLEKAKEIWKTCIESLNDNRDTASFAIRRRVLTGAEGLFAEGSITIAVVGDSVSQGCFCPPRARDYNAVYHNRLRLMIGEKYPLIPVNVLNFAVGGKSAPFGAEHFASTVLQNKVDLCIISFGLNDVNHPENEYTGALKSMFTACKENHIDAIYMTPNTLNTYVAEDTLPDVMEYAKKTARLQNDGTMDALIEAGRKTARECGVPIADAYAIWQKMSEFGVDTTSLLANRVNHPDRPMHSLFAELLFRRLFDTQFEISPSSDMGMYQE